MHVQIIKAWSDPDRLGADGDGSSWNVFQRSDARRYILLAPRLTGGKDEQI